MTRTTRFTYHFQQLLALRASPHNDTHKQVAEMWSKFSSFLRRLANRLNCFAHHDEEEAAELVIVSVCSRSDCLVQGLTDVCRDNLSTKRRMSLSLRTAFSRSHRARSDARDWSVRQPTTSTYVSLERPPFDVNLLTFYRLISSSTRVPELTQ